MSRESAVFSIEPPSSVYWVISGPTWRSRGFSIVLTANSDSLRNSPTACAKVDFPAPGESSTGDPDATRGGLREELDKQEGWRSYGFEWQIPADHNGTMWAALGISVVWETEVTYFVDDLEIQLDPIETGSDRDA